MRRNLITEAVELVGLSKLAGELKVTYQAVRKWERAGKLPRTEWTGETDYSSVIQKLTDGKVTKAALLQLSTNTKNRNSRVAAIT